MAGHSKFKNIQFRKGAQDKKRAKLFAKISKEITVAAKLGLPDPAANPRLRSAIALGRAQNMPKDNIERAVKKVMMKMLKIMKKLDMKALELKELVLLLSL